MTFKKVECIDSGTEFCPCHLAEKGECLLCSQLQGQRFCDCKNWNGVCIYQEYIYNKSKATKGRPTLKLDIIEKILLEDTLIKLILKAPHKLVMDLLNPGSFIFIKSDENNNYFDFPISIESADPNKNTLTMYIEIRGVKTKALLEATKYLLIRAPYYNGTFGLKNINETLNEKCLIISRGIGFAPSNLIIKKLYNQNNEITIVNDINPFSKDYFKNNNPNFNLKTHNINTLNLGELSDELKEIILKYIATGVSFIHCGGADILTYKVIEFLDSINRKDIKLSCCNNAKMCCGEGVCGSCTLRFKGHNIKRLCKTQTDPRSIFEERRFI
ncbi:sulfide/dihydroorotate dehydrogenase-like FAD/NAD-binding protein [uncultured Clostridium sp.]|jgi:NAD(P)H-flavin reductase|uniref:sulfide/dihydroorotate dehydrogenase-like FAD/NAD-binding protein n=1 Tax=uncultured Clostridium sp. TaxID=59620 RepID=UPI002627635A|nr:sulfide/dihydroorotate dehydrogenase-like FAD/NAD-binding protein [uncultured Clostridium sp.]